MLSRLPSFFVFSLLTSFLEAKPLNVVLLTVDDMSCDSVGVYGCPIPDTTPRMDELAAESLRFEHAHVQVGNCYPSRNVMWSGLYPHNNGVEGFYKIENEGKYDTLWDFFQDAGYYTAIRGKVTHTTPYHPYPGWDQMFDYQQQKSSNSGGKKLLKVPASYGQHTSEAIAAARKAGKPFVINVNISDPHKPFYTGPKDPNQPSKVFTAKDMVIPGFLFDDPAVREELALYYSSVRRADDAVGAVIDAVKQAGHWEDTFFLFLSDHGMPLPFAKTSLFHHSTRTPLMIRWPGVTKAGEVDDAHMVSAVDFTPTILEVCGIETEFEFDGRSFAGLLKGEEQDGWDYVYKVYNENSGANRHPMRGIETKQHLYLFNPWSDGTNRFRTATQSTATYRKLVELAEHDKKLAQRLKDHDHRVFEEFYDTRKDPNCLMNLAESPETAPQLTVLRQMMEEVMSESEDHALEAFQSRENPEGMLAYVARMDAEAKERRALKKKAGSSKKKSKPAAKSQK